MISSPRYQIWMVHYRNLTNGLRDNEITVLDGRDELVGFAIDRKGLFDVFKYLFY